MKNILITLFTMLLLPLWAMAQYTGGNGRGDYKLIYSPCTNPGNGGIISASQNGCAPLDPTLISVTGPTGYLGTLEYKWQSSTDNVTYTDLSTGTYTATTYDPEAISVSTWYKRLTKVTCESVWVESDAVKMIVLSILSGTGTAGDPYQISTAEDLNSMRCYLGAANSGKYFKLMNDIDLTAYLASGGDGFALWGSSGWDPIGVDNPLYKFYGQVDGNNRKITGLQINRGSTSTVGLFGCTGAGSSLKNIGVEIDPAGFVRGSTPVGGLVATNAGSVSYCYTTGTIISISGIAGGLIGHNSGCVTKCYATGTVSGNWTVGGLVGYNRNGKINNCYARGSVSGGNIGGLVGQNENTAIIENSYATGLVGAGISGGGLVETNTGTVTNSYWDKETTGRTTSSGSDNSFGKTTAEMKTQSTFVGWDFVSPTWLFTAGVNDDYLILSPPVQASALAFSGITQQQMTISWTNGNESKRAVFVKQASSGTAIPENNTTYTANTVFGDGTQIGSSGWHCVYNGTGISVTVTGLSTATDYIYQVFEYIDGCSANNQKYNTVTATDNPKVQATDGLPAVEVIASLGNIGPIQYSTLKKAFDKINDGTHQGDITIKIFGSTTETATALLNASLSGSAVYTSVLIYPTLTGLSITGNLEAPLIDLNGADFVTIDGRVDPIGNPSGTTKDLTITNTSVSILPGTTTIQFINDASGNFVQYCKVKGSAAGSSSGIVFFSGTNGSTGNNNNTIDHNDITNAADANRPVYGVLSSGSYYDNSGNTVSNNNIFDFFNPGISSSGVFLGSFSTGWNITGNSFYETRTPFIPTDPVTYFGISIGDYSGNNFTVSNNFIGGNAPECGGTMTVNASTDHRFRGIYLAVGTTTASSVQNNTIKNIAYTYESASNDPWCGIYVDDGKVNVGTVTGNTIGSTTGTGAITVTSTSTFQRANTYGIFSWSGGAVDIRNNSIGSITTADDATQENNLYGIINYGSGAITISNNTIGSTTTPNSLYASSACTGENQGVYGIYNEGGTASISGNTIANLTNGTTNPNDDFGTIIGIRTRGGPNTITNNIVRDLKIGNSNTLSSVGQDYDSPSVIGISQESNNSGNTVSGNTIYNLSNTYPSFAGSVIGLYYSGGSGGSNRISNNFIHSLSVTGTSSTAASLYGILIERGNATFYNNVISLGGNTTTDIYGIHEYANASQYLYIIYNTVYIGGNLAAGATNSSYSLFSAGILNYAQFVNNIFHNARSTEGGDELHFAAYFVSDGRHLLSLLTCDYNDYFTPGAGGMLGFYGTIINIPQIVPGQDTHSLKTNPSFVNAGGNDAANYIPTAMLNGTVSEGYPSTDYAGTLRADPPTMGAFEKLSCANPINGGEIEAAQAICLGNPAATLTNKTTPSGQTGTLQYQWQSSVGGAAFTNLTTGTYTSTTYEPGSPTVTTKYKRLVKVTCETIWLSSNEVQIIVNPQPTATAGVVFNVNCFGDHTGSVDVSVSGGTTAYSYSWSTSPVQSTSMATGLASGTYTVTVTVANGCKATASVEITQPTAALAANAGVVSNVSCFGGNNGSVNVSVAGGTTNYSYAWSTSPVQTAATASGLSTGTYYVTVTDGNNCTATSSATLTSPPAAIAGAVTGGTTICSGTASGTLSLGAHTGAIVKWQYSVNPFTTWSDTLITASTFVSKLLTETTQFRAAVQSGGTCDLAFSTPTTVTVIATVAGAVTGTSPVCYGSSSGLLTLTGQTGHVVRWQSSVSPFSAWTPIANTGTTYTSGNLTQNTRFRAVVQNGPCSIMSSVFKLITVNPASVGGSIASVPEICSGTKPANLVLSGHTGSVARWEKSANAAFTTRDTIPITSTTLTGANIGNLTESTYFRAVVKSGACAETNSDSVLVTVNPPTVAGSVSGPSTWVCAGSSSGVLTLTGQTGDVVKWQSGVLVSGTWTYSDTIYTGTTYTSKPLSENTRFRAVVQSGACAVAYSVSKLITVRPNPTFTSGSVSTPNCYGADVEFTGNGLLPNINNTFNYEVTFGSTVVNGSKNAISDALGTATYSETGLGAGNYSFKLKSIVVAACSTAITEPAAGFVVTPQLLAGVNGAVTNVGCHGGENGSIDISVSGGTTAYTYSWSTIPEQTASTATSLTTGTYTVTVTDNNGCTTTASASITEPVASLSAIAGVITEVNCAGGNTGSIDISVSGGTTNYSYAWSTDPVQTTSLASGLTTGTYTVTVTDGNSCTATASATVVQAFNTLTADAGVLSNVGCFGGNTGSIEVSVSGGKPDYTYLWSTSPAQTASTATLLTVGTYTVTVTDENGCSATASAEITQPTLLTANAGVLSHVNCFGENNGSIHVSVSGGTSAYTYSWSTSPAQTASTAALLTVGTYTVTVTDGNGCKASASASIEQPGSALTATASVVTNVSIYQGSDGSVTVSSAGGTTPYSYQWSTNPVQTTQSVSGLSAGIYSVTVTDLHTCTATSSITLIQPTQPSQQARDIVFSNIGSSQFKLNWTRGNGNGCAVFIIEGATGTALPANNVIYPPSTVFGTSTSQVGTSGWYCVYDDTGTSVTVTGLDPSTEYRVHICEYNTGSKTYNTTSASNNPANYTTYAQLLAAASVVENVSCNGLNDGSVIVTVSGGNPSYSYLWSCVPAQTASTATGLSAGTYSVTVTDGVLATVTSSVVVTQPDVLTAMASVSKTITCNQGSDGSVTVSVNGGTIAYYYLWSTTPAQSAATATGLSTGTYYVTVTDENGCKATASVSLTQPVQWWPALIGATPVCQNSTGNIYRTVSGMTEYSWIVSASGTITSGGTSSDSTVTITWLTAGLQTVSVNYKTPEGCVADEPKVKDVLVRVAPTPVLSGDEIVRENQVVTYATPYSSGNGYTWNASHGNPEICFPDRNCMTITWDFPCELINTGYVKLTVTNLTTGCSTTVTKWITINP